MKFFDLYYIVLTNVTVEFGTCGHAEQLRILVCFSRSQDTKTSTSVLVVEMVKCVRVRDATTFYLFCKLNYCAANILAVSILPSFAQCVAPFLNALPKAELAELVFGFIIR